MNKINIIIILIIIIVLIILIYSRNLYNNHIYQHYYKLSTPLNDDNIKSITYTPTPMSKRVIPLYIFQTFYTKQLSPEMQESTNKIKSTNPEFTYILADDTDCYEFIKNNFPEPVADAYLRLIPGAYKADLWRYCVLYIYGGIYLDIKYRPINGFKFINLVDKEHYVLDLPYLQNMNIYGLYNAFMICKPKNTILLKCIEEIVKNVQTKYYGTSPLEPTGPILLGKIYSSYNDIDNIDTCLSIKKKYKFIFILEQQQENILYKNIPILEAYSSYRSEQKKSFKNPHYSKLWKDRRVYLD
jgi:mannosyltransferase OCH1-like enzyme